MVKYLIGVAILRDAMIAFALGYREIKFSHVTKKQTIATNFIERLIPSTTMLHFGVAIWSWAKPNYHYIKYKKV